jgi:cysteine-rich repeat protein
MKTQTKISLTALAIAVILATPAFAASEPENVTNFKATAINTTSIGLSWNSAKDAGGGLVDHYRIYYGTESVQMAGGGDYESEINTTNNNTTYVLGGLTAGTTYYFAITAIDSASVESASYSLEASAKTPAETAGDSVSPTVTKVEVVDKKHVKIVFSEAVALPELLPEAAFTIEEQINPANMLEVISAKIYEKDPTGATILLETAEQTLNVNYIVTAGVAVTDLAKNPIVSGNADSGLFTGSNIEPAAGEAQQGAGLPAAPNGEGESAGAAAPEAVCGNGVVENGETCDDGNTKSDDGCSAACVTDKDITPPEDITNLMLSFKKDLETFIIVMDWTASVNSAKDLVDQILYQSADLGGTYGAGTSLGPDVTHYELPDMKGGKEYTFKITTKDGAGNESVGVVKSIRLPQTGAGLGLLLLGSAAAAGRVLKRKQK